MRHIDLFICEWALRRVDIAYKIQATAQRSFTCAYRNIYVISRNTYDGDKPHWRLYTKYNSRSHILYNDYISKCGNNVYGGGGGGGVGSFGVRVIDTYLNNFVVLRTFYLRMCECAYNCQTSGVFQIFKDLFQILFIFETDILNALL